MSTAQIAQVADAAMDVIDKVADVGGDKAELALTTIKAIVAALRDGQAGKVSPQVAMTQIEMLHGQLATNDEAALAHLRARFSR